MTVLDKFKERNIRALQLNRMLKICDIHISNKSVQNYLDDNFESCKDIRILEIAEELIKNYDGLVSTLKQKYA